jgi:signal peptide peptidase SppA
MSDATSIQRCAAQHFGPWLIEPHWFAQAVAAVKAGTFRPGVAAAAQVPAEPAAAPPYRMAGNIAIIDIDGQITKGDSSFGGASSVRIRRAVRSARADGRVRAIMLRIDSPGGTAAGTPDLADDIYDADANYLPVYSYFEDLGASAAYWIGSQARRVYAGRSAMVGSIGVVAVVYDTSGQMDKEGIKVHVVSTGEYKGAFADGAPVTDAHIADLQREVDAINEQFLDAVMTGRRGRITETELLARADGRVWMADEAKVAGLIDEVATFDAALAAIAEEIMTPTDYQAQHPDGYESIRKAGYDEGYAAGKAESAPVPAGVNDLRAAFPDTDDNGFVIDQIGAKATVADASVAYVKIARERIAAQAAKIAELEAMLKAQAQEQPGVVFTPEGGNVASDKPAEPGWKDLGFASERAYELWKANAERGNVEVFAPKSSASK